MYNNKFFTVATFRLFLNYSNWLLHPFYENYTKTLNWEPFSFGQSKWKMMKKKKKLNHLDAGLCILFSLGSILRFNFTVDVTHRNSSRYYWFQLIFAKMFLKHTLLRQLLFNFTLHIHSFDTKWWMWHIFTQFMQHIAWIYLCYWLPMSCICHENRSHR